MDQQKIQNMALRVVGDMGGAFTMALGHIGDKLGIFKTMKPNSRWSYQELAKTLNLNERYVLEWLRAMVAAEYMEYEADEEKYYLSEEQYFVLADEDSPMFVGGGFQFAIPTIHNVPRIMDAFRKGGGIPYDEIGDKIPCAIERFFRPGYVNSLVQDWLPKVPGLMEKLKGGCQVADVGCGRGQSTVIMARAFPKSHFFGIDYDRDSIASAMKLAHDNKVTNITFLDKSASDFPPGKKFDLICSFDCIHDMVDPVGTLRAIHGGLAADGDYLWSEPNASHNPLDNRNPIGKVFHSVSPLHCMTVSLAYGGKGLGTVIGEKGARGLASEAGFTKFEKLKIDNPFNQFFHLKK